MHNFEKNRIDTSSMKMSPGLIQVVQQIANYWLAQFNTWTDALRFNTKIWVLNHS